MTAPLLSVRNLTVSFGRAAASGRAEPVLHDVSFELGPSARLGLVGESGSGKSLTALALLGLLPDAARVTGSVRYRGQELLGLSDARLSRLRGAQLAMVFQEPMSALDPTMKVGRQVAEAIRLHAGAPPGRARERALEMLAAVELEPGGRIADSYPHQLSGGQRQRVVLAMALANGPDLLICDEPTTALDVTVQDRVLSLLEASLQRDQAACLFISHDLAVVSRVCTEVLVMVDGRIVDSGAVPQVFSRPRHPYTAGLVATARLDRFAPGERLPTLSDFYPAEQRSR